MLTPCEIQTLGNVICMILGAVFAGMRAGRCTHIKTLCFSCDREILPGPGERRERRDSRSDRRDSISTDVMPQTMTHHTPLPGTDYAI